MGVFAGAAAVLFVLGVLALLLEVQSPSWALWSGIKVHGITQNGLTYYTYRGESHAIDNRKASASDSTRRPTTVWLSRSDPTDESKAYIESPTTRWLDFTFVVGWFVVGLGLLVGGFVRRELRSRRRVERMGQSGSGLSDEVVRRILAERRGRAAHVDVREVVDCA